MRKEMALVIPSAFLLSVLVLAGLSAPAAAQTATIEPGQSLMTSYSVSSGESIAYHWQASESVTFTISDPHGNAILEVSASQRSGIRDVTQTGDYTLIWTNHRSTSVVLTYEVTVLPFHVGGVSSAALLAIIIMAVIAVAIVVLIIFVIFRDDRRRTEALYREQQGVYAGPTIVPPKADGRCARCGRPVIPGSTFCEECGARLR